MNTQGRIERQDRLPIIPDSGRDLQRYDPEKSLQTIAVLEAAETHYARAKDAQKLLEAVEHKITEQAKYIVWRDDVVPTPAERGKRGGRGKKQITELKSALPAADPGDVTAHRWRAKLTAKVEGKTVIDDDRLAEAIEDAQHRAVRICEQEPAGTVRGTEGTGEFERYTPPEYIEAARLVLGEIDLDPASCEVAQQTVRATEFFTAKTDGLKREWHGRAWLNPPYHRVLAPKFIDKLVAEVEAGRVTAAILLTNNCTDNEWFQDKIFQNADAICFKRGRVEFLKPNGKKINPTQGQAFSYFGDDVARFTQMFQAVGRIVVPLPRALAPGDPGPMADFLKRGGGGS
jgi:phage N-6-adenine-methyltransferase